MSALDYFKLCMTKKYADFTGRARRSEYWYFVLMSIVAFFALNTFFTILVSIGLIRIPFFFAALLIIYFIAILIPTFAVLVRRLHDTGKSGWWYFIGFVPIIGIALLIFLVQDSQPGTNKWGPNPKAPDNADEILSNLV